MTLNYYPVTYTSPAEFYRDYPQVDARLAGGGHYSLTQDEWEAGHTAHDGDEFYVVIWMSNGAAVNAEDIVENQSVARNVKLSTETDNSPGEIHYVNVLFAGENTNSVSSRFKILTAADDHLEVIPQSGEIYDYLAKNKLEGNLEIGNGTILIGDINPHFKGGLFIGFRIRVSSG